MSQLWRDWELPVNGPRGGHRPGDPLASTTLEPRDVLEVVGEHGKAVAGGDKEGVLAQDHVAVAVPVEGRAKTVFPLGHGLDKVGSIGEVGIRVASSKVSQHVGLDARVCITTKLVPEDHHHRHYRHHHHHRHYRHHT